MATLQQWGVSTAAICAVPSFPVPTPSSSSQPPKHAIMPTKSRSHQPDAAAKPKLLLQLPIPGYFCTGFASSQPPSAMQVQRHIQPCQPAEEPFKLERKYSGDLLAEQQIPPAPATFSISCSFSCVCDTQARHRAACCHWSKEQTRTHPR